MTTYLVKRTSIAALNLEMPLIINELAHNMDYVKLHQNMTWQEEGDHLFARLQQIAPRAVKLYSRPTCERDVQKLRKAMEYWERENDKTVAALKSALIKFQR